MSPPTEAKLECERLRDDLRESESRNDGLEETIMELTEEREASEQRYNQLASTITLIARGVPSVAEYAKLMEACGELAEMLDDELLDRDDVSLSPEGVTDVKRLRGIIDGYIIAFGPPFVTRKPTQEPDDES